MCAKRRMKKLVKGILFLSLACCSMAHSAEPPFELVINAHDQVAGLFDEENGVFPGGELSIRADLCVRQGNSPVLIQTGDSYLPALLKITSIRHNGELIQEKQKKRWILTNATTSLRVYKSGAVMTVVTALTVPHEIQVGKYQLRISLDPQRELLKEVSPESGSLTGGIVLTVLERDEKSKASAKYKRGVRAYLQGDHKTALEIISSLPGHKAIGDKQLVRIHGMQGHIHFKMGDKEKAKNAYRKALAAWRRTGDTTNPPEAIIMILERIEQTDAPDKK